MQRSKEEPQGAGDPGAGRGGPAGPGRAAIPAGLWGAGPPWPAPSPISPAGPRKDREAPLGDSADTVDRGHGLRLHPPAASGDPGWLGAPGSEAGKLRRGQSGGRIRTARPAWALPVLRPSAKRVRGILKFARFVALDRRPGRRGAVRNGPAARGVNRREPPAEPARPGCGRRAARRAGEAAARRTSAARRASAGTSGEARRPGPSSGARSVALAHR